MRRRALYACIAMLVLSPSAGASELIDRNASHVKLAVNAEGQALVSYRARGQLRRVLSWSAVNAIPPTKGRRQVEFRLDYAGGWGTYRREVWKTFRNRCRKYDGPELAWLVTACKAPDGSYWALQRFRKFLPFLGYRPWKASQRVVDLHLSHWTGPLARLRVYTDWAYRGKRHHLFGRLTYRGHPVYGFRFSNTHGPLDGYGRNIWLDTYNSRYGRGWKRENGFVSHRPGGNFCYLFFARPSYYDSTRRPPGNGKRYRATVLGPGVTPIVRWSGRGLPNFNPKNPAHVQHEAAMNRLGDRLAARDKLCKQH